MVLKDKHKDIFLDAISKILPKIYIFGRLYRRAGCCTFKEFKVRTDYLTLSKEL